MPLSRPLCTASRFLAITLLAALAPRPAVGQQADYVADGADVAVFEGESAPLRFRIQNNTLSDAPFTWTIAGPSFGSSGSVLVPRLKDALIEDATGPLVPTGGRTYTITLTHSVSFEVVTAALDVRVVDSFLLPALQTREEEVIVDLPLQKPITIRTIALPVPSPGSGLGRDKEAMTSYPFFVTRTNPDPGTPGDLFDVSPTSGLIALPPNSTIVTSVTVSLPIGGLPYGTMNTIAYHIVVAGDTVAATGQAIFQGACHNSTPSCPPQVGPPLWNVSTYDAYLPPLELRSLWCGVVSGAGYAAAPGYGSCWKADAFLSLGTSAMFSAADGMTLGGVQLYSSETAHDLCRVGLGVGFLPDTITAWREIAVVSGISNPDSIVCPTWSTKPYLCARYEPFQVVVPPGGVPDNGAAPLQVRWRFTSDLTWDDQGAPGGVDTKGAWRIDHVSARGDLATGSYYPTDPTRTLVEDFEGALGPEWTFPPSVVFDCTAVDEPTGPGGLPAGGAVEGPVILLAVPNPAAAAVTIRFALPREGPAALVVSDAEGRVVRWIAIRDSGRGAHEVEWDGARDDGRPAASGVYFVRIEAEERSHSRRIVLLRR